MAAVVAAALLAEVAECRLGSDNDPVQPGGSGTTVVTPELVGEHVGAGGHPGPHGKDVDHNFEAEKSKELKKAGATRMGTNTWVGERLNEVKACLQASVVDPEYVAQKYKDLPSDADVCSDALADGKCGAALSISISSLSHARGLLPFQFAAFSSFSLEIGFPT